MKNLIFIIILLVAIATTVFSQNIGIVWQNCYGGSEDDIVHDVVFVVEGFLIVGGTASVDGDISFNNGNSDFWLIKIDTIGDIIWEKTFGGSNGDFCTRIIPAPGNNYYLLGNSMSSDGDISYDPYPGSNDIWVVKIDNQGNILWDKIIGGGMIDAIESATVTSDGGVAVFGWTGSQNGDVTINYGMYDMWFVKLTSDGDIELDRSFGTDDFDFGYAIIQTSDGGFLIGGTSTIGNNGNLTCIPHSINAEAIILKLNASGEIEWQNCYGGSEHDGVFGLLEVGDGYLISAYAYSNDGDVTGHHGDADIWIIKIDLLGNIFWEQCFGGSRAEIAYCVFEESSGNFLIIGSTRSNDGDVSGNHSISEYDNDIWTLELNSTGELLRQQCFGGEGSEGEDKFNSIINSQDKCIIATQTNFGPSYDVGCTPYGGNGDIDYWVFEINLKDTMNVLSPVTSNRKIKVYPNPANEYLIFEIPDALFSTSKGIAIEIIDIFGQVVISKSITSEQTILDLRQLQNSVYFYRLELNDVIYSGKMVIQR